MEETAFNEKNTPKWLQTIQLNSWEAELLISALVLYALFQVPDYLYEFSHLNFKRGSLLIRFFDTLVGGINLLQFGYILHITVRGIWVASVGFSYVFPDGINYQNLKFRGKFKEELQKNLSITKSVLKLEELSSVIYGLSFTIFGVFVGFGALMFFFFFIYDFLAPNSPNAITEDSTPFGIFVILYLLGVILLFIDFITSGLFRRKEWAVDWFYPIAWFFRFITLSFLYRRSMLVLLSNLKGWRSRVIGLGIAIIVGGFLFTRNQARGKNLTSYLENTTRGELMMNTYENLRAKGDYLLSSIQSDIVSESYLKVFLRDLSVFNQMKESLYNSNEIKWDQLPSDSSSFYLNKWFTVSIDTTTIDDIVWMNAQHPIERIFGFYTYIDIESLARGRHHLSITVDTTSLTSKEKYAWRNSDYYEKQLVNILFQYDKQ